MQPRYGTVARNLGVLLHIPGVMALASVPISLIFGETAAIWPFLETALISFGVGQAFYRLPKSGGDTRLQEGMLIAALAWLLIPMLGAIPFLSYAVEMSFREGTSPTILLFENPWNALFEAYSGFTGTGLTMALKVSDFPASLHWWRSFTEWIGGVGVIVLMLAILRPGHGVFRLYFSEGRDEKIFPTVRSTVRTIWWVFLVMTGLGILTFWAAGMGLWDAINYGMTALSTGGFGTTDHNLADFDQTIRLAAIPVLLGGSISFAVLYRVLRFGDFKALVGDRQHRLLWYVVFFGTLMVIFENLWQFGPEKTPSWIDSCFQWVSALSTGGLQSTDLKSWSHGGKLLLSLAMILGAAAGSTVGGFKLVRVAYMWVALRWRFQRIKKAPHQLLSYEFDGERFDEHTAMTRVEGASLLIIAGLVVLGLAVYVMLHFIPQRFTLSDLILEMCSTQSNVGLSTGITSPTLPWGAKLTMILVMWVGRLEIFPVLFLVLTPLGRPKTDKKNNRSNGKEKERNGKDSKNGKNGKAESLPGGEHGAGEEEDDFELFGEDE